MVYGVVFYLMHTTRLPVIGIDVPSYELPLPEGVGEDKLQQEHMSLREIEETWKEKLYEKNHTPGSK